VELFLKATPRSEHGRITRESKHTREQRATEKGPLVSYSRDSLKVAYFKRKPLPTGLKALKPRVGGGT
jgi:hypothetical protein